MMQLSSWNDGHALLSSMIQLCKMSVQAAIEVFISFGRG